MIAEAASAGKGPVVYSAADDESGTGKQTKQDRMVGTLIDEDFCTRAGSPDELTSHLARLLKRGAPEFKILNDTKLAAERIVELVKGNLNRFEYKHFEEIERFLREWEDKVMWDTFEVLLDEEKCKKLLEVI